MTNNTFINYMNAKAKREQAAKEAEFKAFVETFGADNIMQMVFERMGEVDQAIREETAKENEEIDERFEEAKRKISEYKYNRSYDMIDGKQVKRAVEFSEKTNKAFYKAIKETGVGVWDKKEGGVRAGKVTHASFAKYIIEASGNDPQILIDIINILRKATWEKGYGITQKKMELVYHILVLHQDRTEDVIPVLTKILKKDDHTTLKVKANQSEQYRGHLDYEEKIMMLVEDLVCEQICEEPLYARENGVA